MHTPEPHVVRFLVSQRSVNNELRDEYDLMPRDLEVLAIIYALSEAVQAANAKSIAKAMGDYPQNLLYKSLNPLKEKRFIKPMNITAESVSKRRKGFNAENYILTANGIELLKNISDLSEKYAIRF